MQSRWLALAVVVAACSDPPPVDVEGGRLTAKIYPEPPRIVLFVDGNEVWSTTGDAGAPYGFGAVGNRAVEIEMQFGSFRFKENKSQESWQGISELSAITLADTGATFDVRGSDRKLGTGRLTLDSSSLTARIELTVDHADRFSISGECATDEHLVGLGGQSFDVDHQGETVPLWVQEDGIGKFPDRDDQYLGVWFLTGRKHSTHTPMPMVLSSAGYAITLDTNARATFDLGGERPGTCRFETWEPHLDLRVFLGEGGEPRDAFSKMINWVGKPATPPELIYAPWIDALFGSANVRRVAQKLRDNGISSSVIWSEDWRGGNYGATGYALEEDWKSDATLYPDFSALASDLHGMGFAFHTYNNTFIDSTADIHNEAVDNGYAIKNGNGDAYSFTGVKFNPSTMLDLSNPAAVAWGKRVMTDGLDAGADGWMADFAEWLPHDAVLASGEDPMLVHNRYTVDWARMNKEMFASRPNGIYFMRSAWLHSQPETMVMWAGDQQTDWSEGDGFPSVIPIGLGLGLTGFPYFGSDVGGYMSQGTIPTSEELFYRWTTLGALSPVMRTHHGRSVMENVQWEHDAGTIAHFRRWSRFHMQLAPYFTGSARGYERDGMPLFRLIALDYPDEDWAWSAVDEYLLGDRILVAPVLAEGTTSRTLKLPAGTWYPLMSGPPVAGGDVTAQASKTEIPAYVPAGSILVLYPDGIDTVLASPALGTAKQPTGAREVWLYSGTAANPAFGTWSDADGPGGADWTWSGRPSGALPSSATFNGSPVSLTMGAEWASVTVSGNGTLAYAGGGTLTIQRGVSATTTVYLR
ncbi:MAG TPA: TIM-barrel domain-containing protein [Kofleriaceae bacterium]|nr:TIM-barrel domain-containing protein [Kofleriaceae bacterium]